MLRLNERSRRTRLLLGILLAASLTLVTIDFRSHGHGPLEKVGHALSAVFGPLQQGLAKITRPIGNFFAGFGRVGSLRGRIRELERDIALLQERQGVIDDYIRENDQLRDLLGLRDRLGLKTIAGEVIGVGPSNLEDSIFINRGSADGVRKDMPVVAGGGLVGRVISSSGHTARVILIRDPQSSVAARVVASGEVGLLDGKGRNELQLDLFNNDAKVAPGDEIVTSGYDRSVYPPGIPIGTVTKAEPAGVNLTRRAFVKPAVDFTSLEVVLVVTGTEPRPSPQPTPSPSASASGAKR